MMRLPRFVGSVKEWRQNVDLIRMDLINKASMNHADDDERPWYYLTKIDLVFFGVMIALYFFCRLIGWGVFSRVIIILMVINALGILIGKGAMVWKKLRKRLSRIGKTSIKIRKH